jgi:ABC-2 type transport system ATP-binding protein
MNDGAPPVIVIEDFHKTYRDTVAVAGLSLHVRAGEILGLVGPNGAGKTTTLRSLCGIIPPTRGRITIAGFDLAAHPIEAKSRLAYIPDDPKLFDMLTVAEHLEYMAAAYRVSDAEAKSARLLEQFELTAKQGALAQELSRGMRQKVAICCAYLHDPAAIIFDEPFTGLDPRAIRTLKNSIAAQAGIGTAIIISSHLLDVVEDLCSHLLILDHGERRFFGPLQDVRAAFASLREDESLEEIFFRATEGTPATPDRTAEVQPAAVERVP